MHKDKLLDLHQQLVTVKNHLLQYRDVSPQNFAEYENLGVDPDDDHLPKIRHRHAIFTLGSAIGKTISDSEMDDPDSVSRRMDELAENTEDKISSE